MNRSQNEFEEASDEEDGGFSEDSGEELDLDMDMDDATTLEHDESADEDSSDEEDYEEEWGGIESGSEEEGTELEAEQANKPSAGAFSR